MLSPLRELVRPFYLRYVFFPLFPDRQPPSFQSCWNFPKYLPEPQPRKQVLVFLPMNDWHTRTQRTQHLACELAGLGYWIVYLNPHLGREFPRAGPRTSSTRQIGERMVELHVRLPREPVFHHRLFTPSESSFIAEQILRVLDDMGAAHATSVVSLPVWLSVAEQLRAKRNAPIVYDCHDYLPGFTAIAPAILAVEPDLIRTADLVPCSSETLLRYVHSISPSVRTLLLRNAAAPELLRDAPHDAAPTPVTVGYIGALESWFDSPAIRVAAVAHPEWRFQLIGRPDTAEVLALRELPNVQLLGEVDFAALPHYLVQFTVALIPFRLSPLIEATDPIKLYEYFAFGLPVVASAMPELERFGDLVERYHNPKDFVRKLEIAIATAPDPARSILRRTIARNETWRQRATQLQETLLRTQVPT